MSNLTSEQSADRVSNERLETLIGYARAASKPWLCCEVWSALRELQDHRAADYYRSKAVGKDVTP